MDAALIVLSLAVTFATGATLGGMVVEYRNRREIRRLQDIIMALDESGDEASWMRKFGRKR